jgi:hypothetical protein
MKKENWNYELHFNGVDFGKYIEGKGYEHFVEKRYFDTLHDAFNSLVQTDINKFDKGINNIDGSREHYSYAEITAPGEGEPLVRVVKIPIDDAVDASPMAGIYLNFDGRMDIDTFEKQSGFKFDNFSLYDRDVPFLMLGKYMYGDDGLELIRDQAFEDMQRNIQIRNSLGNYEVEWSFKIEITTRHFEDDLTFLDKHNTRKDGPLVSYKSFHYTHPADAFDDLIRLDMYALNEKTAFNKGLGHHIESAVVSTIGNKEIVSLESITEVLNESRQYENGIYLKFYDPILEFEKLAEVNLGSLDNYNKLIQYQQILRYTTDRNDLLITPGYCKLIREAGRHENADLIINQYPAIAPYVLKIEWDFSTKEPVDRLSSIVRHGQLPFVSYEEALKSLCELDDRSFSLPQSRHLGHPLYIKHAAIYDTADDKPIISKFMAEGTEKDLPGGVYIKLNGEKTTVETLHETLRQLPSIQQQSDFHFMVSQPFKAAGKTLHVRQEDSGATKTIRKSFPWYGKGHSL